MLKRIRRIENIGRFVSCSSGNAEFEKITLLYGRNTYGKSTLCDVLTSANTGDTETLIKRKSIPGKKTKPEQVVDLSFLVEEKEYPVSLKKGAWQSSLPFNFHIFDDRFYYKNLFLGTEITRGTKENFSAFILGSKGVKKAEEIAEKNKLKANATRERNKLERNAFYKIENLPEFLKLTVCETKQNLETEINKLILTHNQLTKQQKNASSLKERKELNIIEWHSDTTDALERFNQTLQTNLQTFHKQAREKLNEHIKANFNNFNNSESWIKQGLEQNNGNNCQFCGQTLNDEAFSLLEIYRESFDTAFMKHERTIKTRLNNIKEIFAKERISAPKLIIESNNSSISSYIELEENEEYQEIVLNINSTAKELNKTLDDWQSHYTEIIQDIKLASEYKTNSPQSKIETINTNSFIEKNHILVTLINQYNKLCMKANDIYKSFKESLEDETLNKTLEEITINGKLIRRKLLRIELNELCNEYLSYSKTINNLSTEIPKLEVSLLEQQSSYINNFFGKLNYFFKQFGSEDFSLEKGEDKTGYKPIYFLKIEFRNKPIPEKDLANVLSESDRRALALAVFWTAIDGLTEQDKKNSIIILDDPVTSFDIHRISSVHQEIISLANKVRQIIVLSHFEYGICHFLRTYKSYKQIQLLSIEKDLKTSSIEVLDIEEFIKSEHSKARTRILQFSRGETNIHNASELRKFFEMEINSRFAKQLTETSDLNLSGKIDKLKEHSIITQDMADKAHQWRTTLNPEHHIWTGVDIEDQRSTANKLMRFIYYELSATPV